jgi:hypothetical protein
MSSAPDTWQHVVGTYGGAMRLHVNSVSVDSATKTGAVANDGGVSLALGAQPQGSNEYDGLLRIDDVTVAESVRP